MGGILGTSRALDVLSFLTEFRRGTISRKFTTNDGDHENTTEPLWRIRLILMTHFNVCSAGFRFVEGICSSKNGQITSCYENRK